MIHVWEALLRESSIGMNTSSQFALPDGRWCRSLEQSAAELKAFAVQKSVALAPYAGATGSGAFFPDVSGRNAATRRG
ncbi:hypothetical protein [Pararhizobium antarcticum]|uniref:hypothetical protein n=1 Tax=Pararhizobium antarcticum TaxID=1798805 RepID=UPI0015879B76|nr:hypothetical protein [Pararhizobium antarcticum]